MPTDLIRYDLLVQDALRFVVRRVLTDAARNGLPGEHHFNITFKTQASGVVVPAVMRQRYPEEMTIILQHEFWDLSVDADGFEVSLNFSRKPERLKIPFDAIVGFHDPSVPFGFKLEPREQSAASQPATAIPEPPPSREKSEPASASKPPPPLPAPAKQTPAPASKAKNAEAPKAPENGEAAKVVSIDAFRKK
jgi:uncharacterized protein